MTDNQQQPYGSDSVPQPAQPAQPAQPSYGQDAAQQPQGYGAPQPAAYAQPAAGSYGQQQPQYGQPAGAYAQPQYGQPAVRPARTARSGLRTIRLKLTSGHVHWASDQPRLCRYHLDAAVVAGCDTPAVYMSSCTRPFSLLLSPSKQTFIMFTFARYEHQTSQTTITSQLHYQ